MTASLSTKDDFLVASFLPSSTASSPSSSYCLNCKKILRQKDNLLREIVQIRMLAHKEWAGKVNDLEVALAKKEETVDFQQRTIEDYEAQKVRLEENLKQLTEAFSLMHGKVSSLLEELRIEKDNFNEARELLQSYEAESVHFKNENRRLQHILMGTSPFPVRDCIESVPFRNSKEEEIEEIFKTERSCNEVLLEQEKTQSSFPSSSDPVFLSLDFKKSLDSELFGNFEGFSNDEAVPSSSVQNVETSVANDEESNTCQVLSFAVDTSNQPVSETATNFSFLSENEKKFTDSSEKNGFSVCLPLCSFTSTENVSHPLGEKTSIAENSFACNAIRATRKRKAVDYSFLPAKKATTPVEDAFSLLICSKELSPFNATPPALADASPSPAHAFPSLQTSVSPLVQISTSLPSSSFHPSLARLQTPSSRTFQNLVNPVQSTLSRRSASRPLCSFRAIRAARLMNHHHLLIKQVSCPVDSDKERLRTLTPSPSKREQKPTSLLSTQQVSPCTAATLTSDYVSFPLSSSMATKPHENRSVRSQSSHEINKIDEHICDSVSLKNSWLSSFSLASVSMLDPMEVSTCASTPEENFLKSSEFSWASSHREPQGIVDDLINTVTPLDDPEDEEEEIAPLLDSLFSSQPYEAPPALCQCVTHLDTVLIYIRDRIRCAAASISSNVSYSHTPDICEALVALFNCCRKELPSGSPCSLWRVSLSSSFCSGSIFPLLSLTASSVPFFSSSAKISEFLQAQSAYIGVFMETLLHESLRALVSLEEVTHDNGLPSLLLKSKDLVSHCLEILSWLVCTAVAMAFVQHNAASRRSFTTFSFPPTSLKASNFHSRVYRLCMMFLCEQLAIFEGENGRRNIEQDDPEILSKISLSSEKSFSFFWVLFAKAFCHGIYLNALQRSPLLIKTLVDSVKHRIERGMPLSGAYFAWQCGLFLCWQTSSFVSIEVLDFSIGLTLLQDCTRLHCHSIREHQQWLLTLLHVGLRQNACISAVLSSSSMDKYMEAVFPSLSKWEIWRPASRSPLLFQGESPALPLPRFPYFEGKEEEWLGIVFFVFWRSMGVRYGLPSLTSLLVSLIKCAMRPQRGKGHVQTAQEIPSQVKRFFLEMIWAFCRILQRIQSCYSPLRSHLLEWQLSTDKINKKRTSKSCVTAEIRTEDKAHLSSFSASKNLSSALTACVEELSEVDSYASVVCSCSSKILFQLFSLIIVTERLLLPSISGKVQKEMTVQALCTMGQIIEDWKFLQQFGDGMQSAGLFC